jgi:hypothetical protein
MTTVHKSQAAVATKKPQGIMMPTHDQLVSTYRSITDAAEKNKSAKPLTKAPAGYQKAPAYNITMPRLLGVTKTAYVIKGEIYVKTAILSPTAKPKWEKVGPAPLF